jgi:hypothetical protein
MPEKKYINLGDVDHSLGDKGNMAGIISRIIYGYHEDVAVWPEEPTGETTALELEAAAALIGDVAMKPGTRAFYFDFTEDEGSFKLSPTGEVDATSWMYALSLVKAKIQKKVLGFANASQTRKMFFIVEDENGVRYLMGNKRRGVTLKPGGDGANTGKNGGERNQMTLDFEWRGRKAYVYEGDVDDILVLVPVTP